MLHEPFPIVGIGASAGGIEALEVLFQGLPPDSGMVFVLVTHLPLGYETTLPDILRRHSAMTITIAGDGEAIEPNHVYVCPSGDILTIKEGRLVLSPRASGPVPNLVDALLHSLADDRGEHAIGLVLSGGGGDGTVGIGAIKEAGGFTMAQGPEGRDPVHASMPATAIATGLVDIVLPIEEIADRLIQLANRRLLQNGLAENKKLENRTEEVDEAKLVISPGAWKSSSAMTSAATRARRSSVGCCAGCRSSNSTSWRDTSSGCAATPKKLRRCLATS